MMMPIAKPFMKKYNVLIIDFPGFGDSEEPKEVWDIFEFSELLHELIKKLKIKNPILIGHSFGGKVSICYASKYETKKVVLLASPFRKSIVKQAFKTKVLKKIAKIKGLSKLAEFAKKHMGSTDYRNASPMMRDILVKHINLDVSENAKKIKCPTLLIWGTKDAAVSYEEALVLEKIIPNCGLVTYEGCTHYAYLERLNQTISIINNFIGSDE
jgi:pimeloyl-ACP methyl ester carboxylesterase